MAKQTQISAPISAETRKRLERYVRATGVKKGHLIEQALLHHLQALESIPAEYIIPARLVVTRESGMKIVEALDAEPTEALRRLMRDGD